MHPSSIFPILPILLLSGHLRTCIAQTTKEHYYNLYDSLFAEAKYKKEVRPAESLNDPLRVYMEFSLLSIVDVDEKQQMLVTSARLEFYWDDDYLSWNSSDFGGIDNIMVPQKSLYLPDIVLANSVSAQKQLGYDNLPVRLISNGEVDWEPTVFLSTDCDIDITYFPFETQLCKIEFETAVSKSTDIDIDVRQGISAIETGDFTKNGQWDLIKTSAENLSNEDSKTKIRFSLLIRRRRTFYVMNIVLPVFFLSLTASLVFALPADEGEKMGTGITVLLAFAVYLTIVSDLVPNTSLQVSLLALYLTILLALSAFSVVICALILRIHFRDPERPVGSRMTRFTRIARSLLCLNDDFQSTASNRVEPSDDPSMDKSKEHTTLPSLIKRRFSTPRSSIVEEKVKPKRPSDSRAGDVFPAVVEGEEGEDQPMTWQMVAHTLDWICFILFTLATFLVTLILLLYLHFGSIADAPSL